jgi:hypothetical protein
VERHGCRLSTRASHSSPSITARDNTRCQRAALARCNRSRRKRASIPVTRRTCSQRAVTSSSVGYGWLSTTTLTPSNRLVDGHTTNALGERIRREAADVGRSTGDRDVEAARPGRQAHRTFEARRRSAYRRECLQTHEPGSSTARSHVTAVHRDSAAGSPPQRCPRQCGWAPPLRPRGGDHGCSVEAPSALAPQSSGRPPRQATAAQGEQRSGLCRCQRMHPQQRAGLTAPATLFHAAYAPCIKASPR